MAKARYQIQYNYILPGFRDPVGWGLVGNTQLCQRV